MRREGGGIVGQTDRAGGNPGDDVAVVYLTAGWAIAGQTIGRAGGTSLGVVRRG
jgi:hypothetical protein